MRCICVFFCKRKTAYELRISDWSSDVCSSDLPPPVRGSSPPVCAHRPQYRGGLGMIGKLLKGRGARGLINYLLGTHDHNGDERPRAEVIGGTLAGRNERELAAELRRFHPLRPHLGVPVAHMRSAERREGEEWCR